MKFLAPILFVFLAVNAQASTLALFCDKESPQDCLQNVDGAMKTLGCEILHDDTFRCQHSLKEDPRNPGSLIPSEGSYCEVTSLNCSSPMPGNFGGENCFGRKKIYIPKTERVHNGYWMGLFGSYSRTVCIDPAGT